MPASYPGSIKSFTTKVDGVDNVLASHMNDIQLEIAAIETELATDPSGTNYSTVKARIASINNAKVNVLWTPYHDTSTIVGWSSYTTKRIYYKKIGDLVLVTFNLNGTSNSTTTSFTVPYTANSFIHSIGLMWVADNGSIQAAPGYFNLNLSTAVVNLYKTTAAAAWTASGTKECYGQLSYYTTA